MAITPVPVPDSYALAQVSLGLLGGIARRQRKSMRHNA
ncbi:MAG: PEP-CTERM sorting domain-containing protein [Burkholderiales bacterium]|nr:MAG: PEP-CTERM sorting domain-containing protein [Burkholderiales bacterium]